MRLLIVGDGAPELEQAAAMARARGATVRHVARLEPALAQLRDGQGADLLLLEATADFAAALGRLRAERIHLPVVAFGISCPPQLAVAAIRAGAREFLPMPAEPAMIATILAGIGDAHEDLVCADPTMTAVLELAGRYAPAEACVLITGESGTGKEMVARLIHRRSRRGEGPFVAVNCAAIPENLLESELFGHERGAFTGAVARRIGRFEEADGGTLLLDEISEMEPRLQAKLLRAIQEREIDRVGGTRPIRVNPRLIATSNRDLERAVAEGSFRADLLFRLNVLTLRLPALRERPADIAVLARHFAHKLSVQSGLAPRPLSQAALAKLSGLTWRGNVRELENCVHRALILARGTVIEAEDIVQAPAAAVRAAAEGTAPLVGRTVAEVERVLILDTLRHTAGNRTHAAAMLGISIRTLRNKLHEYGAAAMAAPLPETAA
ncbi:MAG: sigma-54 dependent transcriptional regulator [Geminicoccaceae bacterium]